VFNRTFENYAIKKLRLSCGNICNFTLWLGHTVIEVGGCAAIAVVPRHPTVTFPGHDTSRPETARAAQ
jgi:hypothetical protein